MSQVLPVMYSFTLFIFCFRYAAQTLDTFVRISDGAEFLSDQDLSLMICAQQKANHLNLWEAYYYLLENHPQLKFMLTKIREDLAQFFPHPSGSCAHKKFPWIHASSKKQNKEDYPGFWPNWVLCFRGGVKK